MPSHEEHCQESLKRYGKSFSELHRWMDEPSTILGPHHRRQRHNPYTTPKITAELFGHLADQACFDHIRLDELESRRKGFNSGTSSSRRTGQPKSMSSGAWALFALITFVFGLLSISTNVFGSLFCFLLSFLSFLAFLGSTNPPKPVENLSSKTTMMQVCLKCGNLYATELERCPKCGSSFGSRRETRGY